MSVLKQVQPVGINTDFIKDQPMTLIHGKGFMGSSDSVTFEDGTPFLKISRDMRKRVYFMDANSDSMLFEMKKESFRYKYHAEHPDGSGKSLFDIDIDSAFMGGPTAYVQFPNVANGGSMVNYEYKIHTFENINYVHWGGQAVAEIETSSLSRHTTLRLAPCVDPLPIIAMLMALSERAKKKGASAGAIGGAAGAAGGGGGGGC